MSDLNPIIGENLMELLPGATNASEAHSDAVEEFVYVTDGEVDIHVEDLHHHLQTDDLLRFNATLAHAYENLSKAEVGLFIIIVYE